DFLQCSQQNRLARCSCRESGRSCGTKTMTATRAGMEIREFLRNPLWFSARHVPKANPLAASLARQGLERETVKSVLLRMKKHPAFWSDGWFIEQPIFVARFNRGVLVCRVG